MKSQISLSILIYIAVAASFFALSTLFYLQLFSREYSWYANASRIGSQLYNYAAYVPGGGIFIKG